MNVISAQLVKALRERTGAGMMDCKKALEDARGDADRALEKLRERGLAKAIKRAGRETSEGTIALALAGSVGALVELGCETDFVAKTPEYLKLAQSLSEVVATNSEIGNPNDLLEAEYGGRKVRDVIADAVGKMGENVVPKRLARLSLEDGGQVGGYVHAGGKLGVLVGIVTDAQGDVVDSLIKDLAMHVAATDPSPLAVSRDGIAEHVIARESELFRRQAEQEGKPEKVIDKIVEGRIRKFYSEVCLLEQPFVKDLGNSVRETVTKVGEQLETDIVVADFVRFKLGEAI